MDAYILEPLQGVLYPESGAAEVAQWLESPGDIDDLIYYGEEPYHSER